MTSRNHRRPARPARAVTAALAAGALLVLSACSGGSTSAGAGGLGGAAGGGDGEGTTLVIPTSQAPWNPAYAEVIDLYERETGNTVELREFPNDEVKTQEVNDVNSGANAFDVYQVNESDLAQFLANDWLRPFTDVDPDYALDPEVYTYDDLTSWDADTQLFSADGQLTSAPINGNLWVYYYRADLFEQLGLQPPTTWDDVVANGQALQASGDVRYGGAYRLQAVPGAAAITSDFQAIMAGEGARFFAEEGTDWTPVLDSPEAVESARILRQLAQQGPDATTTMGQGQAIAAMQAGDAGQSYLVAAAAGQLENEANSNIVGQVGYAPLPAGPDGARTATGIWSLAIPAGLPDDRAQTALEFIDFVTSQEAQTVFAKAGGVPVRSDYGTDDLPPATSALLDAVSESAADATGQVRYVWATDLLNLTEPALARIAAGEVSPEDGMAQLQADVTALVQRLGLPVAG